MQLSHILKSIIALQVNHYDKTHPTQAAFTFQTSWLIFSDRSQIVDLEALLRDIDNVAVIVPVKSSSTELMIMPVLSIFTIVLLMGKCIFEIRINYGISCKHCSYMFSYSEASVKTPLL